MSSLKITAIDGRVFEGTTDNYAEVVTRVTKYEEELKVKKEKAEAEAKLAKEKADKITEIRQNKLKEIQDDVNKLNNKIHEYEKETGLKVVCYFNYLTGEPIIKDANNTLSLAYDNVISDLVQMIKSGSFR